MKKVISILVLTLVCFIGYAQEPDTDEQTIELEDVLLDKNLDYLKMVQDENTPPEVAKLQFKAANYNVKKHSGYSKSVKTDVFEMAFKNKKGAVHAFYDHKGEIESAFERFHDIILPRTVLVKILKEHQGYNMVSNFYLSSYDVKSNYMKRTYEIELKNGADTKTINIDASK